MFAIKLNKSALSMAACILVLPSSVSAWTPCLPFCDSTCGAPALTALGSSVQSGFGQQQANLQSLGSELASTNNRLLDLSQRYVNSVSNDTFDRLSSLAAATSRIESGVMQIAKAKENFTDFKISQWRSAVDKYFNASQAAETARTFGDVSQTETGRLGACSAGEIKRAQYADKQVSAAIIDVQKRYLDDLKSGDSALANAIKNESSFADTTPLALLHDSSIPDDMFADLQGLLTYIVTPNPHPLDNSPTVTPGMESHALEMRRINITYTWIAGIAAEVLARKAVYGELRCNESYLDKSSGSAGSSMNELMTSKVNGRVTADGYWGAIKQLLPSGLRRELVYLKGEENMLIYQRQQVIERRNQLLAFIAASRVRSGSQ